MSRYSMKQAKEIADFVEKLLNAKNGMDNKVEIVDSCGYKHIYVNKELAFTGTTGEVCEALYVMEHTLWQFKDKDKECK